MNYSECVKKVEQVILIGHGKDIDNKVVCGLKDL